MRRGALREADVRTVRLLEADPGLADALEPEDAEAARRVVVARVERLDPGPWQPAYDPREYLAAIGLLIIDGLVTRTVSVEGREFTEVLGPGDLLRPWQAVDAYASVPTATHWRVVERTELAVLDARFAAGIARWPGLMTMFVHRTMERTRTLAFHLAVCHMTRVEHRLLLVLWHLADRYGRVGSDGVVLRLRLTHQLLASVVGARRPSVTVALQRLIERGLVTRADGRFVLHGAPPEELARLRLQTSG
jgi:CRP-like cAMP-binding protein